MLTPWPSEGSYYMFSLILPPAVKTGGRMPIMSLEMLITFEN